MSSCHLRNTHGPSGYSTTRDSSEFRSASDSDHKSTMQIDDDRIDSGLGSITASDAEKELRKITETDVRLQTSNDQDDKVLGGTIPEQTDSITKETSVDEAFKDKSVDDEMYDAYIPTSEYGASTLHNAILNNKVSKAIELIASCPEPACLDFFTSEIHTALHIAVHKDLPEIVRFLIVYGANFNTMDRRGNTPLHMACELGRLSCAKMIVSALDEEESVAAQERNIPQDINLRNYEGLTPLHLATINNRPKVVEFLVQQPQIKVNIGDSTCGRTALHHALERKHKRCFINLLKSSVNVNATTFDGCSPLHVAVGLELEQETRYLMTRGANVQIATMDDIRAIDLARTQKIRDALQYSMLSMPNLTVRQR